MVDHVNDVVLPGQTLSKFRESEKTQKAILGPGLRQEDEEIIVSKPGILRFREPNVYWVDSYQKRVWALLSLSKIHKGRGRAPDSAC